MTYHPKRHKTTLTLPHLDHHQYARATKKLNILYTLAMLIQSVLKTSSPLKVRTVLKPVPTQNKPYATITTDTFGTADIVIRCVWSWGGLWWHEFHTDKGTWSTDTLQYDFSFQHRSGHNISCQHSTVSLQYTVPSPTMFTTIHKVTATAQGADNVVWIPVM
jgi:hypothetical protein